MLTPPHKIDSFLANTAANLNNDHVAGSYETDGGFSCSFTYNTKARRITKVNVTGKFSQNSNINLLLGMGRFQDKLIRRGTSLPMVPRLLANLQKRFDDEKVALTKYLNSLPENEKNSFLEKLKERGFDTTTFLLIPKTPGRLSKNPIEDSQGIEPARMQALSKGRRKELEMLNVGYSYRKLQTLRLKTNRKQQLTTYSLPPNCQNDLHAPEIKIDGIEQVINLVDILKNSNKPLQKSANLKFNPFVSSKAWSFFVLQELISLRQNGSFDLSNPIIINKLIALKLCMNQPQLELFRAMNPLHPDLLDAMQRSNLRNNPFLTIEVVEMLTKLENQYKAHQENIKKALKNKKLKISRDWLEGILNGDGGMGLTAEHLTKKTYKVTGKKPQCTKGDGYLKYRGFSFACNISFTSTNNDDLIHDVINYFLFSKTGDFISIFDPTRDTEILVTKIRQKLSFESLWRDRECLLLLGLFYNKTIPRIMDKPVYLYYPNQNGLSYLTQSDLWLSNVRGPIGVQKAEYLKLYFLCYYLTIWEHGSYSNQKLFHAEHVKYLVHRCHIVKELSGRQQFKHTLEEHLLMVKYVANEMNLNSSNPVTVNQLLEIIGASPEENTVDNPS